VDGFGLGSAAREHDLFRFRAEKVGDPRTGLVQSLPGFLAEPVHARRVPKIDIPEIRKHLLQDLGIDRGRGVVVEVDPFLDAIHFPSAHRFFPSVL
jgi:hypothetical protein